MSLISVVIPVYNEQPCLEALFERLLAVEQSSPDEYELLFVDDGSTDGSRGIIQQLAGRSPRTRYICLSRNFGHEAATTAGIDHATGEAVVIIDADLQDPPEVIPRLIEKWREGCQIVYARREVRKGESALKRLSSWLFYRIIGRLSEVDIPPDTGDFRLIDRRVARQFRRCREQSRFVRGLVAWTGFRQAAVTYERDARFGGRTKYGFFKLILLAFDAVLGFSSLPLRLGILVGLLVCVFSLFTAVRLFVEKLFWGITIPGYALMATGMFFLGGVQLSILGLLGEYICRIYRQVQQRPLYVVDEKSPSLPQGDEGWLSGPGGEVGRTEEDKSGRPDPLESTE